MIQGAFMHVKESLTAERFLRFLADEAPGGHYFIAQPPPGVIMTAAIDWRVVVPDRAAIETLAAALWSGYESLVKPQQCDERTPLLLVQLKNLKGEGDQFTVGKDFDKKEGFLHRVRESSAVLLPKNHDAAVTQELEKTAASDYWLAITPSDRTSTDLAVD